MSISLMRVEVASTATATQRLVCLDCRSIAIPNPSKREMDWIPVRNQPIETLLNFNYKPMICKVCKTIEKLSS